MSNQQNSRWNNRTTRLGALRSRTSKKPFQVGVLKIVGSWGRQKTRKAFLKLKRSWSCFATRSIWWLSWLLSPSGKCIWRCVCICICICISICNVFVFVIIFVAVGVGLQHNQSGGSVAVGHDGAKVGRISIIDWTKAAPVFFSLLIFQFSIYRILSLSFCLSVQCIAM